MEENKTDIFVDEDAIGALPEDESAEESQLFSDGEILSAEETRRAERAEYGTRNIPRSAVCAVKSDP